MTCKLGGYIVLRHDAMKEMTASLLRDRGCRDVQTEPMLLNITNEQLPAGANTAEGARLDISARAFGPHWTEHLRVLNPQAGSNCIPINQMYRTHKQQKKNMYMKQAQEVKRHLSHH